MTSTYHHFRRLLGYLSPLSSDASSTEIEEITEEYLYNDEDTLDQHVDSGIICMSEHVSECVTAGLTSSAGMDNDLESLFEADIASAPPRLISRASALTFLQNLIHYFHSLQFLRSHGSSAINISDLAKSLSYTRQSLNQFLATQKKQSSLDS